VVFITIIFHLTNLYITEHHAYEAFILRDGGLYTQLFWYGQIIVGSLIPMALFYAPGTSKSRFAIGTGALLVIVGGFAQVYVIVVGGQAFPMAVFPGYEVSSSFFDGVVMSYTPSPWELILGIGGIAVSVLLVSAVLRVLPFAPTSLADSE